MLAKFTLFSCSVTRLNFIHPSLKTGLNNFLGHIQAEGGIISLYLALRRLGNCAPIFPLLSLSVSLAL